jgi:cytochrome b561
MRAELEAMRKQFQTAPAAPVEAAAPVAAAIPYERRAAAKPDFFANARMVVWTLAIVAALWVTFHALQASSHHAAKQDHILASVTGKEKADDAAADQNSDN